MKPTRMIVAAAAALPLLLAPSAFALTSPVEVPPAATKAPVPGPLSADDVSALERLLDPTAATAAASLSSELLRGDRVDIALSTKGDPMQIPFLVSPVIRQTALNRMNEAYAAGRNDEALRWARYLVQEHSGTEEAGKAQNLIEVLGGHDGPIAPKEPEVIRLPPGLADDTISVLFDTEDPVVVVGHDFYRVGQALRDHSNVVVESIHAGEVVYRVNTEFGSVSFAVTVQADR